MSAQTPRWAELSCLESELRAALAKDRGPWAALYARWSAIEGALKSGHVRLCGIQHGALDRGPIPAAHLSNGSTFDELSSEMTLQRERPARGGLLSWSETIKYKSVEANFEDLRAYAAKYLLPTEPRAAGDPQPTVSVEDATAAPQQAALATDAPRPLNPCPEPEIREEIRAAYRVAKGTGAKPPNINELADIVQANLEEMGWSASKQSIRKVGMEPEFIPLRLAVGHRHRP